jgi:protein-S-isoprenylcysteine O-methyltransferase Ste14
LNYLYLILAWLVFGLLHSVLAAGPVKRWAMQRMGGYYKYYRLAYSIFATVNLLVVLRYHFLCERSILWNPPLIEGIIALLAAIAGLAVMATCIVKYFPNLSGVDALLGTVNPPVLEQGGMHKYVRHPLYSGTLLFVWAIFLGYPYLNNLISGVCITVYTVIGTYFEEKKLVSEFGESYRSYQEEVPMFLPLKILK